MFQIAFGLGKDTQHATWVGDAFRDLVSLFDKVVYSLIKYVYAIFFNIASAEIIQPTVVKTFYGRIQLLLGVIMIFKFAISLLQVIINPELLTDQKQGFGKIITKIIMMLVMFVAIIPLNIPKEDATTGSYNEFLNQYGLLFGTLQSLQYRILENNTIAKIVLSNQGTTTLPGADAKTQADKEKAQRDAGDMLAGYVIKPFLQLNKEVCPSKDINNGDEDLYSKYEKAGADYLLSHVTDTTCYDNFEPKRGIKQKKAKYALAYCPVISTVCGLIVLVCLLGFCIDIAIRTIKLAVLRLIAPIPIISYINPKSSENGTFANWVKMVTTTYLDLFIRLAIIYFIVFLVQGFISSKGVDVGLSDSITGALASVFIIIGLFFFARQAPKFIRDALGIKGGMSNVGLAGILGGAGALATGGDFNDVINAGRQSGNAQIEAFNQGKQGPRLGQSFNAGRDMMAQELTGNDKMTYDQMRIGRGYLRHNNVNERGTEDQKIKMYDLKDEAAKAKNKYEIFAHGEMTNEELDDFARRYGHYDAHGGADGNGGYVLNDLERTNVLDALENDYLNKEADAGRAESKYKDMQTMLDKYGGSRSSYRAKHGNLKRSTAQRDTRFSDFTTREGREAIKSGGVRAVAGAVADATRNLASDRRNERDTQRTERINERDSTIKNYNDNLNQSRNNRP